MPARQALAERRCSISNPKRTYASNPQHGESTTLLRLDSDDNWWWSVIHVDGYKNCIGARARRVLLVGNQEEDFFLIREIFEPSRKVFAADLDHAQTLEQAKAMLQQKSCGLVLFEHETGDAEAVHFVAELLHAGVSIPFILLTEDANEETVADIIESGTWNCVAKSQLDGATLVRTMRDTPAMHCLQQVSTSRKSPCENCLGPSSSRPTRLS